MAKRKIKSLNKTGRITREEAIATALSLRKAYAGSGKLSKKGKKITRKTTASGRSMIAFHVKEKCAGAQKSAATPNSRSR